ncbi:DUF2252 domain-containing protein [Pseudanabaena sp. UWO311]|uniref:DUF2252 domain-containing protein n=1 Tax=Pseudanabaena sp. UWO311 TaxID=2487337 RepID=UPI00115860CC|nr:DUF2252 family protein [Pseudanabaena sp. UWO311]TYQ24677.1 DUF2252 domain-containing protein [Pseudanabaena sp. UWO311]
MANRNIRDRIYQFNLSQPRDPDLLKAKYQYMREEKENPFIFFRSTCHLFYEDLPIKSWFKKAPLVWICGDLHVENFGNYKADNRHVYFDINDFDEAMLAPCTWEIARLLTSIFVSTETYSVGLQVAEKLCKKFLNSYLQTISDEKAYWMGEDMAPPVIEDLLARKNQVKRRELLEERTVLDQEKQRRSLKIDFKKAQPITDQQRQKLESWIEDFAAQQPNPKFFKLLDVAQRIAGKGSLGIERYVLLVEGKGSPDGNYLLDLKRALPSSLAVRNVWAQPTWKSESDRIVSIQKRLQAIPIAFLHSVTIGKDSFVLRELQSTQSPTDHLKIEKWDDKLEKSEQLMLALGEVVAWSHLRSSAIQGSATIDQLIDFAGKSKWKTEVMEYAKAYSQRVHQDWKDFCQ